MRAILLPLVLLDLRAAEPDAVRATTVEMRFPVQAGKARPGHQAAKLAGLTSFATPAVVLENSRLRLTLLPELGGRLIAAVLKEEGREVDLFWRRDEIVDGVSWSMGGGRWSFPFYEHGRRFDETTGYAIVRGTDGAVTVAMDMRFEHHLRPEETRRYGRATNLRLAQYLRLEPGQARFRWSARVDNPLPLPCGFKLWFLLRQPAIAGTHVLLPTAAVTGHGASALQPWDPQQRIGDLQTSVFAIARHGDTAGWHSPDRDLTVLACWDRRTAPGAKQVLYRPSDGGYIEMWGGNHEVFEECGRLLPAFGSYRMDVEVAAQRGAPPADALPPAGAPDERSFAFVRACVAGTQPGGRDLAEECSDLVTEHGPTLLRGAERYAATLREAEEPVAIVDAARRLLRVRRDAPEVEAGLGRALVRAPHDAHANLLRALWLIEAGRDAEARPCLERAAALPGGRFLLALAASAAGDHAAALAHLDALLAMDPRAGFRAGDPALAMLQDGAAAGNLLPRLLRAIALRSAGRGDDAGRALQEILADDPACCEAWLLLGDAERVRTMGERNPDGLRAAEATLAALRAGRWRGIGRP